tara:strand:+ start:2242 stop:3204 length:963 start_codon:yes stop_codon:yes gene_type:complete
MKNIFITGITGFVGSHMADYILKNTNDNIVGFKRWMEDTKNIDHLIDHPRVKIYGGDLVDYASIDRAIRLSKPDKVFHFAAQSFPETSFRNPVITLHTNIIGTTHLFESIKVNNLNPIIVSVSSSEVYGNPTKDELPIKESNPIRPANPYSISKVGHDLMSQYYHNAYNMKIITTRMFSHEGARRGKEFAVSSFAYQIAKAEKNGGPYEIKHGNLDSVRTYNHIDDAIEAYWLCSEGDKFGGVYNIGGDESCKVGEALDVLISKSNKSFTKVLDEERVRPTDITLQIPDTSRFRNDFNWKPKKNMNDIWDDLLEYWRDNV